MPKKLSRQLRIITDDSSDLYECDNCEHKGQGVELPDARDLFQRLEPGGIYTNKECPHCGALCFPCLSREAEERRVALVAMADDAHSDEGAVEVDDCAQVSELPVGDPGKENGAYVQAWVWVSFEGTPFDESEKDNITEDDQTEADTTEADAG